MTLGDYVLGECEAPLCVSQSPLLPLVPRNRYWCPLADAIVPMPCLGDLYPHCLLSNHGILSLSFSRPFECQGSQPNMQALHSDVIPKATEKKCRWAYMKIHGMHSRESHQRGKASPRRQQELFPLEHFP